MSRHQVFASAWHRFRFVSSCSLLLLCGANISLQAEEPAEKKMVASGRTHARQWPGACCQYRFKVSS